MPLSKSEAGKIGALKTIEKYRLLKEASIIEYNKNPSICSVCEQIKEYSKRMNKFCSSSCSAKFNNAKRTTKYKNIECLNCNASLNRKGKYCNHACQQNFLYKDRLSKWINDEHFSESTARKHLLNEQKNKCLICGIEEWNGKSITLELDHIDGNALNNAIENLRMICPNCHSQTPTFKGRNKGNGARDRT